MVIGAVIALLLNEEDRVDRKMLGMLIGSFLICASMFIASFCPTSHPPQDEEKL